MMTEQMLKFANALHQLRPGASWSFNNDNPCYETLTWLDTEQEKPTELEITTKLQELAALEYKDKRSAEYPSIGDQLDALFHAGVFPEDMTAQIQAIKDKYPKV